MVKWRMHTVAVDEAFGELTVCRVIESQLHRAKLEQDESRAVASDPLLPEENRSFGCDLDQ